MDDDKPVSSYVGKILKNVHACGLYSSSSINDDLEDTQFASTGELVLCIDETKIQSYSMPLSMGLSVIRVITTRYGAKWAVKDRWTQFT